MNATSILTKPIKPQTWQLEVRSWLVITHDHAIEHKDQCSRYPKLMPGGTIKLNVAYDDQMISVDNAGSFTCQTLVDDKELLEHELSVWITHKQHAHTISADGLDISWCVACEILIEGVVVTDLITGGGMILLGENDRKMSLQIKTPIYRWLLANKSNIFKPYPSDPIRQAVIQVP